MSEKVIFEPKRYQILSGGTLKIIAILSMLIDHIGASIVERLLRNGYFSGPDYIRWSQYDFVLRLIGRIAFPIFAVLLVEGFLHTRNVKKYALRLGAFGVISEWPFDMAFFQEWTYYYQNVFLTLLIGLLCIWAMDSLAKNKFFSETRNGAKDLGLVIIQVLIALAGMALAIFLKTDYDMYGVLAIIVLYIFRRQRGFSKVASYLALFRIDGLCFPGFFLAHCYSGKQGIKLKYFFYLFYPAHLIVLWYIGNILMASK